MNINGEEQKWFGEEINTVPLLHMLYQSLEIIIRTRQLTELLSFGPENVLKECELTVFIIDCQERF